VRCACRGLLAHYLLRDLADDGGCGAYEYDSPRKPVRIILIIITGLRITVVLAMLPGTCMQQILHYIGPNAPGPRQRNTFSP